MPRIRNIDDPDELRLANAEGLDWVGRAPTVAPVTRVRDVLLIPTSTAEGDWDTYPPVSTPPVDLGRGLMLTELDHEEAELVMNACTPISLNSLVGQRFRIGSIECIGRRLAEPCAHLEKIARPGLLRPLVHRGGLRADIIEGGVIRLGDEIEANH